MKKVFILAVAFLSISAFSQAMGAQNSTPISPTVDARLAAAQQKAKDICDRESIRLNVTKKSYNDFMKSCLRSQNARLQPPPIGQP